MTGAVEGPKYASWALATHGFFIPCVFYLNFAHIASDNWNFLSHLLFNET